MKKILKIIAIILVILALLLLLQALVSYLGGPNALGYLFGSTSWLGSLSLSGIIILAAVGLVIAAVISPKGFKKAMDRVTSAVSVTGSAAGTMVTKGVGSLLGGIAKGLGTGLNWLWIGAAALGVYALWPSSEERSARARARLDELQVEAEERKLEAAHNLKSS